MPHMLELDSDLQTKLNRDIVGPWTTEIIVDPDGANIDISDYLDKDSDVIIRKKKNIMPYSNIGAFSLAEINIRCLNVDDEFNSTVKDKLFYHATTRLYSDADASDNYINVPAEDNVKLTAGMTLTISDGNNSVDIVIGSSWVYYTYCTKIYLETGTVGEDFDAGAMVETYYLPGRKVTIKTKFTGVATKINQFTGILRDHPTIRGEYAELIFYDYSKQLLEVDIKANSFKILTDSIGGYEDTIEVTRAGSSTGTLTLSDAYINIYGTCKIGSWIIEFMDDSGGYQVTDPDGIVYEGGDISSTFYVGGISAYQLYIPSTAWTGSDFEDGDIFEFQTSLALGQGITSIYTIPEYLYFLLTNARGANLSTSLLNTTAWNSIKADFGAHRGAITFTRTTTVLKAIELLQAHINACIFVDNDGLFSIDAYRPKQEPDTTYTLSPDADIEELEIASLGRIERIKGQYYYSHSESGYQNQFTRPEGAEKTGTTLVLSFPAYSSSDRAQARATVSRILRTFRHGLNRYQANEKFNYGIAFDINEEYEISSDHPTLGTKRIEIYELIKNITKGDITILGYDLEFLYGNYAFTNVHYTDRGKVTW